MKNICYNYTYIFRNRTKHKMANKSEYMNINGITMTIGLIIAGVIYYFMNEPTSWKHEMKCLLMHNPKGFNMHYTITKDTYIPIELLELSQEECNDYTIHVTIDNSQIILKYSDFFDKVCKSMFFSQHDISI